MALPTGQYRALLLYSDVLAGVERFFFVLPDTGERGEAVARGRDKQLRSQLAVAGKLSMIYGTKRYSPSGRVFPVVTLGLRFEPRYDSNRILTCSPTGESAACDIRRDRTPSYEKVEF